MPISEEAMAGVLRLIVMGVAEALEARVGAPVAVVLVAVAHDDCHSVGNISIPDAITLLAQATQIMQLQTAPAVGPVQ